MRRSNRLILLIGLFFAVIAFVGVFTLLNQKSSTAPPPAPTTTQIVVAAQDIPQGTVITQAMVGMLTVDIAKKPADSYELPGVVIGQIARINVASGAIISSAVFSSSSASTQLSTLVDTGLRAISVQVDQQTGVGTLIKPGDMVDVVLSMNDPAKNPIVVEKAPTKEGQPPVTVRNFAVENPLLNSTTVKVVVQNAKVIGVLLPAAPTANAGAQNAQASPAPNTPTLNEGQNEIVMLAVAPQDAEIIRFAQLDGNLSLLLRSPADASASPVTTTGITLRQLVDKYGVLPPKIILTTQP